jgi:hypothetical protein
MKVPVTSKAVTSVEKYILSSVFLHPQQNTASKISAIAMRLMLNLYSGITFSLNRQGKHLYADGWVSPHW